MKHKQNGSVHIVLVGILIVLIGGMLAYALIQNLNPKNNSQNTQPTKDVATKQAQNYVEFKDWKVRFISDTPYTLKLNSNRTAYFISIQGLAKTCTNPSTPWLGIIQRFENPIEKQTVGPDAGKTMDQIFGSRGKTIDGKLYYFDAAPQFCTRNTKNSSVEAAAKKLETEIKSLEGY